MWSDTLLAAERAFQIRFAAWGALSTLVGLGLLAVLAIRGRRSPLLDHLAVQTAAWGTVAVAIAVTAWVRADLRDLAGAARLAQLVWVAVAVDVGMIAIGLLLAARGWTRNRSAPVGAGIGLSVQGGGWLALHLGFAAFLRTAF